MSNHSKAYPSHRDGFSFAVEPDCAPRVWNQWMENANPSFKTSFSDINPFQKWPRFYRKLQPNFNDPMVLFYMLDALVQSREYTYIRPSELVSYLNNVAPMYFWTTDLVGRIISGIYEASVETFLDEDDERGMAYVPSMSGDKVPLTDEQRKRLLPFAKGRDGRGKYYIIDPQNGGAGRLWLLKFRHIAAQHAFKAMQMEADGDLGANQGKAQSPGVYYTSMSPDPISSAQSHFASLRPGVKPKAGLAVVGWAGDDE